MGVKNLILQFDVFPHSPQILFQKNEKYHTYIGLFFSLCLYTIFLLCVYTFGQEMVERKYPIVSSQTKHLQVPPIIPINPKTLPIAVGIFDYELNSYVESEGIFSIYFNIVKTQIVLNETSNQKEYSTYSEQISSEICQQGIHFAMPDMENFWKSNTIGEFYCFPEDKILEFGGSDALGNSTYIEMFMEVCQQDNSYENGGRQCASKDIINNKLNSVYILIASPQINIDPSSQKIFEFFAQPVWTAISINFQKTMIINFKQIEVIADKGYFLEDLKIEKQFSFSSSREMADNLGVGKIFQIYFEVDNAAQFVSIQYTQIQEVIAEIGGCINICLVFLSLIASKFVKINFYSSIIEENMNLLLKDYENQAISKNIEQSQNQKKSMRENINYNKIELGDFNSSSERCVYKRFEFLTQFEKFQFGLGIGNQHQRILYQVGKKEIEKAISIKSILKLKNQFEMIKYIFLDPKQNLLFRNFSRTNLIFMKDLDLQSEFNKKFNAYTTQLLSRVKKFVFETGKQQIYKKQLKLKLENAQGSQIEDSNWENIATIDKRFDFLVENYPFISEFDSLQSSINSPKIFTTD